MTAKKMMESYGVTIAKNWNFEKMLKHSRKLDKIDPTIFKYLPFLEEKMMFTKDAYCVFEQCVAIEKGWAN